ncbi:hypothetical protein [Desulfovibrio sp. UCD-KL4C]|uniref:hypothetical protein n=1 Tax=Desulfovibrio sp. UCD-KL4C TaxID=2578120 RepID=UPI0025B8DD4F|nr:hypothetical protein [Desulfovibrio sp. UCD-KL4C]
MCGFKIRFSGFGLLVVAVCLVMTVASGAVAGGKENAPLDATKPIINSLERKIFKLECEINNVYDMQILKIERSNDNFRHMKEWVESERKSLEQWYESLSYFTTIAGILIAIFGVGLSAFSIFIGYKQKKNADKNKESLDNKFNQITEQLKNDAKTKRIEIEQEWNEFEAKLQDQNQQSINKLNEKQENVASFIQLKEQEIQILAKKCDAMTKVCELKLSNIGKLEDEAYKIVENISTDSNNSNESQKDAVEKFRKNDPETTYLTFKAMAISHQYKKEWDKSLKIWQTLSQEFPDKAEPYFFIGFVYGEQAKNAPSLTNKEILLNLAEEQYKKATEIDEKNSNAWNNWGILIAKKYEKTTEEQKEALFIQAQDKFKKATEIDEKNSNAWNNWGKLLILEATRNPNKIDNSLLEKAKEKCLKVESIKSGESAYNLACIASLQNDFIGCQKWLTLSKEKAINFVSSEHLKTDTDLNNFKNDPEYKQWFEDFVEEVRKEEEQEAKGDDHQNTESEPDQE